MKVMSMLFTRWKGAKCTTEHPMHVLRAYRVSLASLRPNQVSELNIVAMYCSHSLHIFSNYIVNMVVCICWIIADYLGAI